METSLPDSAPDPILARRTRWPHHLLFGLSTLMLLPQACALFCAFNGNFFFFTPGIPSQTLFLAYSSLFGTLTGIVAWCALGLLYLQRTRIRAQQICWTLVTFAAIGGLLTSWHWIDQARVLTELQPLRPYLPLCALYWSCALVLSLCCQMVVRRRSRAAQAVAIS